MSSAGFSQIASRFKLRHKRDRTSDTEAFTSFRKHLKVSRSRLEDLKSASLSRIEQHRNEGQHKWADSLLSYGEHHGGQLGELLMEMGRAQSRLEQERGAQLASAQERFLQSVTEILDVHFSRVHNKKMLLYSYRGAVDEASSKVKHYRQKMKSGKSRQEAKMESSIRDYIQAENSYARLNSEIMTSIMELEAQTGFTIMQSAASFLLTETQILNDSLLALEDLKRPIQQFLAKFEESRFPVEQLLSDSLPAEVNKEEAETMMEVLDRVCRLQVERGSDGSMSGHRLLSLTSRTMKRQAQESGDVTELRAQQTSSSLPCSTSQQVTHSHVFGQLLEQIPSKRPARSAEEEIISIPDDLSQAPWVVQEICWALDERVVGVESIFTEARDPKRIQQAKEDIQEKDHLCLKSYSMLELSLLLKTFLMDLPDPLIPHSLDAKVEETSNLVLQLRRRDPKQAVDLVKLLKDPTLSQQLSQLISFLPQRNLATLKRMRTTLVRLMRRTKEEETNMRNFSVRLGPCVCRPRDSVSLTKIFNFAQVGALFLFHVLSLRELPKSRGSQELLEGGGSPQLLPTDPLSRPGSFSSKGSKQGEALEVQLQWTGEGSEHAGLEGSGREPEAAASSHDEAAGGEEEGLQEEECFAGTSFRADQWKTFKIEEGEESSAASLHSENCMPAQEEAGGGGREESGGGGGESDYTGTLKSQAMTEASAAASSSLWHSLTPTAKDRNSKALLHRRCRSGDGDVYGKACYVSTNPFDSPRIPSPRIDEIVATPTRQQGRLVGWEEASSFLVETGGGRGEAKVSGGHAITVSRGLQEREQSDTL